MVAAKRRRRRRFGQKPAVQRQSSTSGTAIVDAARSARTDGDAPLTRMPPKHRPCAYRVLRKSLKASGLFNSTRTFGSSHIGEPPPSSSQFTYVFQKTG